jgi:hypothetical protein
MSKNFKYGLEFIYRAGPVPPETGRTGPVPTGFANPGRSRFASTTIVASAGLYMSVYMYIYAEYAGLILYRHCQGESE